MFARYSVKKPYTVVVGIILVIVLGVISFMNMTTDLLPSIELPYVVAYATYVGGTPEQVEAEVTRPMEASMATVGNVKEITSTSSANVAAVIMEFNSGTNMDTALIEISSRLDQLSGDWPDAVGAPIVMKINPDMLPVTVLSVSREDMDIIDLSAYVENEIIPRYESIAGVASANASGLIEQTVSVTIDQSRIDVLNSAILKEVDSELAEVEQQLTDAEAALSDGKRELARQRGRILGQIDDGLRQLEDGEDQMQTALDELRSQRAELQAQLDQVNAALDQFGSLPSASDEEVQAAFDMIQRLETLRVERLAIQAQIDLLNARRGQGTEEMQQQRADLLAQREELLAERAEYESYIADLNAQSPEALRREINNLEADIARRQAVRDQTQSALDALVAQREGLAAEAEELRALLASASEAPSPTATPRSTATPKPTAKPQPQDTEASEATDAPDETEAPAETEAPEGGDAPAETEAPESTENLEGTGSEGDSDQPVQAEEQENGPDPEAVPSATEATDVPEAPGNPDASEGEAPSSGDHEDPVTAPREEPEAAEGDREIGFQGIMPVAYADEVSVPRIQARLTAIEVLIAGLDAQIEQSQSFLNDQDARIAERRTELERKVAALAELEASASDAQSRIAEAQSRIDGIDRRVEDLDAELARLDETIAHTKDEDTVERIRQLEAALAEKDAVIEEIENSEAYQAIMALVTSGGNIAEQYAQLQQAKTQLEEGIAQLDAVIGKLERGIVPGGFIEGIDEDTDLADARRQLESGRRQAIDALNDAEAQLLSGEEELAKAWQEFEEGREEAFKQARLDGVITQEMVAGIVAAQNFSMPAGYARANGVDYLVRVGDKLMDVGELKRLKLFELGLESVDEVRMADVARVELTDNHDSVFTKVDGQDGIMLTLQKQSIYSTAEVAHEITARSAELMDADKGLKVVELFNQGMYIDLVVNSVLENLMYGGALAILVLLLFLLDFRPTVIIAFSIPVSVVAAFVAMYFTGVTLNVISLAGLALGVGMLVDNSIVVIDNIYRLRQEEGLPILRACVEGVRQVAGAITASTLTTICVFLPVVFVQGMSRDLFTDMGLTIAYSLLASLLVAMTVVPTMCASLLKRARTVKPRFFQALQNGYARLLRGVLRVKFLALLAALALLAFAGAQVLRMGLIFMPEVASTQMTATLAADPDKTFAQRTEQAMDVMDEIMQVAGIDSVGVFSGGGAIGRLSGGSGDDMTFYITLLEENGRTNRQIADEILERTKGLEAEVSVQTSTMDISLLAGSGISIEVTGPELPVLREIATDLAGMVQDVPGTTEVSDGLEESTPELTITVDKEKAIDQGMTVAQVFQYLAQRLYGAAEVTQMNLNNKALSVTVADGKDLAIEPGDIADMEIESTMGEETRFVRIGDIADISETESMSSISRKNQQRLVTVRCSVDNDHNVGLVSREIEERLADYSLPSGYSAAITGESETINNTIHDLVLMILLAVVFIFMIMVAQFQSFKSPVIVLFTIPLALTGGLLALILMKMELSIVGMLGFLVLSGVIVNNGIVFVDGINQLRIGGMGKKEAIVETGRQRLRPILMTAVTTILGMLTMALGTGMGAEMMQPMAIVTIGGLLYATLMTLFVVPCLYDLFNGERMKAREIDMRAEEMASENAG